MVGLLNRRTGQVVVERLTVCARFFDRLRGYCFRPHPGPGRAMLLLDTPRVHTVFLRFAVDLYFLDGNLRLISALTDVPPCRFPAPPAACRHTLELPSPHSGRRPDLRSGDRLSLLLW